MKTILLCFAFALLLGKNSEGGTALFISSRVRITVPLPESLRLPPWCTKVVSKGQAALLLLLRFMWKPRGPGMEQK